MGISGNQPSQHIMIPTRARPEIDVSIVKSGLYDGAVNNHAPCICRQLLIPTLEAGAVVVMDSLPPKGRWRSRRNRPAGARLPYLPTPMPLKTSSPSSKR